MNTGINKVETGLELHSEITVTGLLMHGRGEKKRIKDYSTDLW